MKPLASRSLVPPRTQKRACTLSVSRAALDQRLGKPIVHDEEGDGMGPRYRWESTCECGLDLFIEMPVQSSQEPPEASLWMEHVEVDHALAHLGLSPRDHAECLSRLMGTRSSNQSYSVEARGTPSRQGWAVIRQDEHGNQYEVAVHPQRRRMTRLVAS